MMNLLPHIEKKKVRIEYRLRFAVVLVFTLALLVFINAILLAPSYVRAFSKHNLVQQQFSSVAGSVEYQKERDIAESEASVKIREINKKLNLFISEKTQADTPLIPSEMFRKIIELKTPAIKIFGITYNVTLEREQFVVIGKSADRDNLDLFEKTLKKEEVFTSVELPISSYAKSVDIEFSITLERKNKNAPVTKKPK